MQPDLLQQLKNIHEPAAPGWWPPAPGWWIVASLVLVLLALLARTAWLAWQRRRPIRRARSLHAVLARRRQAGELAARDYADACNELLKRLFIHGLGIDAARRVSDERWLALLDAALGESAFTEGPGRALGEARFAPAPAIDAAALETLVTRLLAGMSPRLRKQLP
jgi:ABC-type transport system involved in cytochrome c biogenesis permease subunit